jgi:large subunit ribosomal protein L6
VGKRPIILESSVSLSITPIAQDPKLRAYTHKTTPFTKLITLEGPMGKTEFKLVDGLSLSQVPSKYPETTTYSLTLENERFACMGKYQKLFVKRMWGCSSTLLSNAATGVHEGFYAIVRLVGVGYKASLNEDKTCLLLKVGFSHIVQVPVPKDILQVEILGPGTKISLLGIDKQKLMEFAHALRAIRKPNVYSGKGIYVDDEQVKLKAKSKK